VGSPGGAPPRGRGYATEALRALAALALAQEEVRALRAVVERWNTPSQGVVTRAGFTLAGEDGGRLVYELRG
jgi:RimJ/RimL family protein N-acetyltransferase